MHTIFQTFQTFYAAVIICTIGLIVIPTGFEVTCFGSVQAQSEAGITTYTNTSIARVSTMLGVNQTFVNFSIEKICCLSANLDRVISKFAFLQLEIQPAVNSRDNQSNSGKSQGTEIDIAYYAFCFSHFALIIAALMSTFFMWSLYRDTCSEKTERQR